MKKIIFGIFAHPDDEAFGPAGALLTDTKSGTELHLITLTSGQNGTNPDNVPDLGEHRLGEWNKAADLLGAFSRTNLGFTDGKLGNVVMLQAAEKIDRIVDQIVNSHQIPVEIEFMTLDLNGLTGHIDHIVAARAASLVFFRHKKGDERFTKISYFCLSAEDYPEPNTDWIYMEAGRRGDEVNETVDARQYRDEIIAIMNAHHSQRHDAQTQIAKLGDRLGLNYFIVKD